MFACLALVVNCFWGSTAVAFSGDVWRDATLYRDEWGVPHIYADNPFAMGFVFGYAQAEDHAEHLLLAYRMANGRLAAVLGEAYADSDAFSLKMGHAKLAESAFPALDPATQAICEGFSMGVNAWIVENAATMPPWADGMQPQDILALWHAFIMSMAPLDLPDVFRRPPAMGSANAWVMSAERSSESAPVLVMNPHQSHTGFFQWYEAHLVLGEMNVYGATLRGLPVIMQGHNEFLGWALSPNLADFADVFREEYEPSVRQNPKDPRVQPDDGGEQQALLLYYMSHSVPYHVSTPAGIETRYVPAYIGERGPIIEHPSLGLHSWFIGGYTDFGGLRQLLDMGSSKSLEQFVAALSMGQIPCFHVLYADQSNNIFYLYNTKTGVRLDTLPPPSGDSQPIEEFRWDAPLSHSLAVVAWREMISLDNLPHIINPQSGFLQACGNPPWTATSPQALDSSLWPVWLVHDPDTYRARRVRQLLRQEGQRSFRDHQSMLFDAVAPAAFDLVPILLKTVELRPDLAQTMHPDFETGVRLLREWNCVAETFSPGMTFFHLWWTFCFNRGMQVFGQEQAFTEALVQGTPVVQEVLLRSVEDAARALRNEHGVLEIPWGDVHRIRRGNREAPLSGANSGEPIFLTSDYVFDNGRWIANYGYGFAMVVQFADLVHSVSLLPFGISQVQGTPHFDDQLDLFLGRQFKKVRYFHDDILRNTSRAMGKAITLLPPGVPGALTLHSQSVINAVLKTTAEPLTPIPPGLVPFCLYIKPERSPTGVPVHVEVSLHIPNVLCDDTNLQHLRIFRYEAGLDWHASPQQHLDPSTRVLYLHDNSLAEWYAVLGPTDAMVREESQEEYLEQTPLIDSETSVGLDALLSGHTGTSAISGKGRVFHLERHDVNRDEAQNENTEDTDMDKKEKGPVFEFERHDIPGSGQRSPEGSALIDRPGVHFGPDLRRQQQLDSERARVFNFERHDTPVELESSVPLLPGTDGSASASPTSEGESLLPSETENRTIDLPSDRLPQQEYLEQQELPPTEESSELKLETDMQSIENEIQKPEKNSKTGRKFHFERLK